MNNKKFTVEFTEKGPGSWTAVIHGEGFAGTAPGATPVEALAKLLDYKKWHDSQLEALGIALREGPKPIARPSHLRLVKKEHEDE